MRRGRRIEQDEKGGAEVEEGGRTKMKMEMEEEKEK